jgi:hypothetical protein
LIILMYRTCLIFICGRNRGILAAITSPSFASSLLSEYLGIRKSVKLGLWLLKGRSVWERFWLQCEKWPEDIVLFHTSSDFVSGIQARRMGCTGHVLIVNCVGGTWWKGPTWETWSWIGDLTLNVSSFNGVRMWTGFKWLRFEYIDGSWLHYKRFSFVKRGSIVSWGTVLRARRSAVSIPDEVIRFYSRNLIHPATLLPCGRFNL